MYKFWFLCITEVAACGPWEGSHTRETGPATSLGCRGTASVLNYPSAPNYSFTPFLHFPASMAGWGCLPLPWSQGRLFFRQHGALWCPCLPFHQSWPVENAHGRGNFLSSGARTEIHRTAGSMRIFLFFFQGIGWFFCPLPHPICVLTSYVPISLQPLNISLPSNQVLFVELCSGLFLFFLKFLSVSASLLAGADDLRLGWRRGRSQWCHQPFPLLQPQGVRRWWMKWENWSSSSDFSSVTDTSWHCSKGWAAGSWGDQGISKGKAVNVRWGGFGDAKCTCSCTSSFWRESVVLSSLLHCLTFFGSWCMIRDMIHLFSTVFFGLHIYKAVFEMSLIVWLDFFRGVMSLQDLLFKA